MILAEIAMYIFIITLIIVLSYKAIWIAFLLVGFRFVQYIIEAFFPNIVDKLDGWMLFVLYASLGIMLASALYFSTFPFVFARYIILVIMFVIVLTKFSLKEIIFFTDYYESLKIFNLEWLSGQLKELFTLDGDGVKGFLIKTGENIKKFFSALFS